MATEPEEMREIATQFYRTLMTEEAPSEAGLESRRLVLSHVQRTVADEMRARLLAPFYGCEIHDVLWALARDSCLGEDGLLPSFFLRYWDLLGAGLRLAFQEVMHCGSLPEVFSRGPYFSHPQGGGDLKGNSTVETDHDLKLSLQNFGEDSEFETLAHARQSDSSHSDWLCQGSQHP